MSNKKAPLRHKVFGISDSLLDATRAILMGQKQEVELEPEEEKKLALAEDEVNEHKGDKPHKHPHPPVENEAVDMDSVNAEKALKHDCAKHVNHEEWGKGHCVPGMHTIELVSEDEGTVTHYDVMFSHGVEEDVPVEDLEIVTEMHHGHSRKKKVKSEALDAVDPSELKGKHKHRKDKDIDNDGDEDDSDKYLHKRRKAVHKAIKKGS